MDSQLTLSAIWTLKERQGGLWVAVRRWKNIFTDYGLSQLASAIQGSYAAPVNLVIDSAFTTVSLTASAGAASIQTAARVDIAGDTQLVLNPGGGTQETVTFTSVTGTGPFTYNLSGTTANLHSSGEAVVRNPRQADTLSSVVSEIQFDATNFPNQRVISGSGFSSGTGNWTMQFYITASQALTHLMTVGISETNTVGTGHLHNHAVLGYNHSSGGNDVEIDVSLTLTN